MLLFTFSYHRKVFVTWPDIYVLYKILENMKSISRYFSFWLMLKLRCWNIWKSNNIKTNASIMHPHYITLTFFYYCSHIIYWNYKIIERNALNSNIKSIVYYNQIYLLPESNVPTATKSFVFYAFSLVLKLYIYLLIIFTKTFYLPNFPNLFLFSLNHVDVAYTKVLGMFLMPNIETSCLTEIYFLKWYTAFRLYAAIFHCFLLSLLALN